MATFAAVLGALEERSSDAEARRVADEARACNTLAGIDDDARRLLERRLHGLIASPVRAQEDHPSWTKAGVVAQVYLAQAGWHVAESQGPAWIQKVLTHSEHVAMRPDALASLLPLLELVVGQVMGREGSAHPEYYRVVVAPHVPKAAAALVTLAELAPADALVPLLTLITKHLGQHASTYRPHVSKLHALCMRLLFHPYASVEEAVAAAPSHGVVRAAAQLLSALHLTGAVADGHGKVSQAQLWLAPFSEMLDAAFAAVQGVAPSLGGAMSCAALGWGQSTPDYALGIPASHARMQCLIGDGSQHGVLLCYLTTPTPKPVPVPIGRIFALARAMLRVRPQPSDAPRDQLRMEQAYMPQVRRTGLRLFALAVLTFQEACWRYVLEEESILEDVCAAAENAPTADTERLMAIRALGVALTRGALPLGSVPGAGLVLDPASTRVQRLARLAISACSQVLLPPAPTEEPAAKQARLFESDAVALAGRMAQDHLLAQSPLGRELADAGLALFLAVFGPLSCSPMPGSRDLARTGALVVLGIAEAFVEGRLLDVQRAESLQLALSAVRTLTALVVGNKGALLAYVLLRTRTLLEHGALSRVALLRATCQDALAQTLPLLRPRAPPVFDSVDSAALETHESDVVPLPRPAFNAARRGADALCKHNRIGSGERPHTIA
ncbi:hypothetical protein MOBT1_000537 [Malassezia obtusa]|uniref:Pre-rRNA-processing protein RIX1 N-terminal domain-containing protein n=1 Tax=Malassezia obtusa TaxID=76774 RepID=A0AAF0E1I4_9BASI|nr:hypothetical protein MOBT1_000537 [Malassezia obtusa]